MKRNMIILVSVLLAVTLAVGGSIAMANPNGTLIAKELSADEASLGDHITVTLNVTDGVAGQTVVDELPDELSYIPSSFTVNGTAATPEVDGQVISYNLTGNGNYTIEFDVQVTSTEAGNITVTNNATVAVANASAELLITPYEGFTKKVVNCTEADAYNVSIETDVDWWVAIYVENIDGDNITTMQGVVVKDRLGGDLELLEVNEEEVDQPENKKDTWSDSTGNVTVMWTGKTLKAHITWDVGDLDAGDSANVTLLVSTDINPGTGNGKNPGHQEYTEAGPHDLNSGAVLKFIDVDGTGFQLSAHTPPITVVAVE